MKKQTQREKIVAVQEKGLESVKGGSGEGIRPIFAGDPDSPKDTLTGG